MLSRFHARPVRALMALCLVASLALIVGRFAFARQTPQQLKAAADKLWDEKSYELARENYENALKGDPNLPDKPEIELRMAIARIQAQQWRQAEAEINAYVKKYPNTDFEARAQVWRGRLYVRIPHEGYMVGKKFYRGSDVPKAEGKFAPQYVNRQAQDAQLVRNSWRRAKELFERFRQEKRANANAIVEEIGLNFDIANLETPYMERIALYDGDSDAWRIDLNQPYHFDWESPKKVLYLFEQIPALEELLLNKTHHYTVLAALGEASYLMQLRQFAQNNYQPYVYDRRGRPHRNRHIHRPLPYLAIDPIKLLEDTYDKYPNDSEADRLAYTIALWTEQKGDYMEALRLYNLLLVRYPKSRYVSDAQAQKQDIMRPTLSLTTPGTNLPNRRATFYLNGRNVKSVHFTAYRVNPEEVYGKAEYHEKEGQGPYRPPFSDFARHFGQNRRISYNRAKIAEWNALTSDNGRHQNFGDAIQTPFDGAGAYLIEAVAGERGEIQASVLVLVSDLAIVQKIDKISVLIYAANAVTGKPVQGVNLVIWAPKYYYTYEGDVNETLNAVYLTGTTNGEGQFRAELPTPVDTPDTANYLRRHAETFAIGTANRYAVTPRADYFNNDLSDTHPFQKGWAQTDRPLYRPAQDVNYRVVLTQGLPAVTHTAPPTTFKLTIRSPRGVVQEEHPTTDANGAYSGNLTLKNDADLGEYTLVATIKERPLATVNFRVEEYKKPEFAVTVQPEKSQVRVGERMRVNVEARYFFGAPVMRAKVHYRVMRVGYQYPVPFRDRLEWYADEPNQNNGRGFRGDGEDSDTYGLFRNTSGVLKEGDMTTDEKGMAHIEFPTDPPKPPKGVYVPPGYKPDQRFIVFAEVTDDTRRQVTASGAATATATEFRAWMRVANRFVTTGTNLRVEALARDGGDKPVTTKGYIHLNRLIPAVPEIKKRDPYTGKVILVQKGIPAHDELAGTLFVQTDADKDGVGFTYWNPDTPGDYRLDYVAKDKFGSEITTSTTLLVYGRDFDSRLDKNDNRFQLTPEFATYRPGDTARCLLVTPMPNAYVLFTEAVAGGITRSRTIFVPGRSTLIDVPITASNVPNLGVEATILYKGMANVVRADIGVPAEDRILTLTVTPDKPTYQPGEKATFKITARDANGRPVKGQFSLAVVDRSLLAIQPDMTPDIRREFYGYRLQTTIAGANSVSYSPGQSYSEPPAIAYERHQLLYPEGMGYLRDYLNQNQPIPSYIAYNYAAYIVDYEARDGNGVLFFSRTAHGDKDDFGMAYNRSGGMGGRNGRLDAYYREPAGAKGESAPAPDALLVADESAMMKAPAGVAMPARPSNTPLSTLGDSINQGALVEAVVRKQFSDTATWLPNVTTDADGIATVSFEFPANITDWDVKSIGLTTDVKVGMASASAITKKNVLVRLQAPRFFVERDAVVLSANVHNYLPRAKSVRVELVTEGEQLTLASNSGNSAVKTVTIKADDEIRLDWRVDVKQAGITKIKVVAQTDEEADAAELAFPVLVHGVEKFLAQSGVLRDNDSTTLTIDLPAQRRKGVSHLDVQLQPSLAATVIDALPYLEDYPYGCIEQTLSRFVPTVLTAKALRDTGIDLKALQTRAAELEKQRAAIPPQEAYANSGYTYPKGKPGVLDAQELASRLNYPTGRRSHAPVFDDAVLKAMVDEGLQRIAKLQREDGGFGWWEGSAEEDPYLTAYVADGLLKARSADIAVNPDVLRKALSYLEARTAKLEDLHLLAYFLYVLTESDGNTRPEIDALYARRDRLNAYGQALLALALNNVKDAQRAAVLVRNLATTAKVDRDRGTAHWESDDKLYWRWYNDKQETTAMVLRALVQIGYPPADAGPVVAPNVRLDYADATVKWLVDNRRGTVWTSTRQTANVVEALLEYAKKRNELAPNYTVTVDVDGKVQREFAITKENALFFDNRFLVGDEILSDGKQSVHITMKGTGTLYFASYLSYFDLQEPIKGAANAIGVERTYYKITPKVTRNKKGEYETDYDRAELKDGAQLTSGDIVEVELSLKSDNDYDYLVFEDTKPAGCEAVETRSGEAYGDGLCSNFELRDTKVAFFVDHLPQGESRITYRLRAEIPGAFHALPTNAYAFYTPDIRALSDEWRVTISDAPPAKPDKTSPRFTPAKPPRRTKKAEEGITP